MKAIKFSGVVFAVSMFMFSGCGFSPKDTENVEPESMLPADSFMVMVADGSDEQQVANLGALMDKFPGKERFFNYFKNYYDGAVSEDFKYEDMIAPIFDGDWKIAFGFSGAFESGDMDTYIVGKFSEVGDVEDLIEEYFESNVGAESVVEYKEENGIKYWVYGPGEMYIIRYGDLFVLTNKEENLAKAISAVEGGENFAANADVSANIAKLAEKNLAYFYMNMGGIDWDALSGIQDGTEDAVMGSMNDIYKGFKDMYFVVTADEGGIATSTVIYLNEAGMEEFGGAYSADFVNKVPGEGLFSYFEGVGLNYYVSMIVDAYGLTEWSKYVDLFSGPFAFAMYDVVQLYPAASFYLSTSQAMTGLAKGFIAELDSNVSELIKELDILMLDAGQRAGLLQKDVTVIAGGSFYKLFFNFDLLSEDFIAQLNMMGMDVSNMVLELYYGMTGDGTLVVSLYPYFSDVYGKDILSNNENFNKAVSEWKNINGGQFSYFDIAPLLSIADTCVETLKATGVMGEKQTALYSDIKENVSLLRYIVGVSFVEENALKSLSYMSIEE
ncbi:MAG: hypothetical protein WC269_06145 [Candidatus Gracilibacteria bacterium]